MILLNKKQRKGFTLIEVLIACLMVIALTSTGFAITENMQVVSNYHRAKAGASVIFVAVSQYKLELKKYPASLSVLIEKDGQYGPWLDAEDLLDPWNQDYGYSSSSDLKKFAVWSKGSDGTGTCTDFVLSSTAIGMVGH